MTPQQIADYKQKWMSDQPYSVELHSDYRSIGKDWCKGFLMKHQYVLKQYTDVYEDTWFFENQEDADDFAASVKRFSNKITEAGVSDP